eukprot:1136670-Pelagomonas_calceolata.AAC.5
MGGAGAWHVLVGELAKLHGLLMLNGRHPSNGARCMDPAASKLRTGGCRRMAYAWHVHIE